MEDDGSLSIRVGRHALRESTPVIYQERDGGRVAVQGGFQLNGDIVSFVVGGYDRSLPLVIDPVLSYLTLLGGSGADAAMSLAVDGTGAAYVAGFTSSSDFPTANPEQNFNGGGNEVFVAKLNSAGNGLVYCTYIGGRADDRAYGIAVDSLGRRIRRGLHYIVEFSPSRGAANETGGRQERVRPEAESGGQRAGLQHVPGRQRFGRGERHRHRRRRQRLSSQ